MNAPDEVTAATLEVLGNPELRRQIEEAIEDIETGRVELIPYEEVKRKLAARRARAIG